MSAPKPDTNNNVLRSLPYQAPQVILDQIERLKKWRFRLAAALALLILASAGAFVYFRFFNAPTSSKEGEDDKIALAADKDKDAKPKADKRPTPFKSDLLDTPAPKKIAPAPPPAEGKRDPLLEVVGGLSTVHLYQTYLNIGLLADAVENETYTKAEATNILQTVGELINLVEKQLNKLPTTDLSDEDKAAVKGVHLLTSLLRTQSTALLAYWAGGEETYAMRYHAAREQSWNALKEILGLDE